MSTHASVAVTSGIDRDGRSHQGITFEAARLTLQVSKAYPLKILALPAAQPAMYCSAKWFLAMLMEGARATKIGHRDGIPAIPLNEVLIYDWLVNARYPQRKRSLKWYSAV